MSEVNNIYVQVYESVQAHLHRECLLDKNRTIHDAEWSNVTEHCVDRLRDWANEDVDNINLDAIIFKIVQTPPEVGQPVPSEYRIIAANLYTHVTMHGIIVPYYEWLYTNEYYFKDMIFFYDPIDKIYRVREKDPIVPSQPQQAPRSNPANRPGPAKSNEVDRAIAEWAEKGFMYAHKTK